MTSSATYTLTNEQTGDVVATLTADDFALWSTAPLLLAMAKTALTELRGQEYLQLAAVIAQAENNK